MNWNRCPLSLEYAHLELDPWIKNPILVRYKGQDFGRARKADRHLNSQLQGGEVPL